MSESRRSYDLKSLMEDNSLIYDPNKYNEFENKKDPGSTSPFYNSQSAYLGPQLWEKTIPFSPSLGDTEFASIDDFQLEKLDFEQFLCENDLPPLTPSAVDAQTSDSSSNNGITGCSPTENNTHSAYSDSVQDGLQSKKTPDEKESINLNVELSNIDTNNETDVAISSTNSLLEQRVKSGEIYDSKPEHSDSESTLSATLSDDNTVNKPVTKRNLRNRSTKSYFATKNEKNEFEKTNQNDDLLVLATPPGERAFNPANRAFHNEELIPQPIIKKSRKIFVPDEHKDQKYWARRNKNNTAARRSREARRIKENQIVLRAGFLETQNARLKRKLDAARLRNQRLLRTLRKYEPEFTVSSSEESDTDEEFNN